MSDLTKKEKEAKIFGIRFRGRVPPGVTLDFIEVAGKKFEADRFIFSPSSAKYFSVQDLSVRGESLLGITGALPAVMFAEKSFGVRLKDLGSLPVNSQVKLSVNNKDLLARDFDAVLLGEVDDI